MSSSIRVGNSIQQSAGQAGDCEVSPRGENRSSAERLDRSAELEYALGWFTYHASQRLAAFNFFLIVVGVVVVGYAQALVYHLWYISLALSLYGGLISFAFWCLEIRNKELVNIGRAALDRIEAEELEVSLRREDRDGSRLHEALGPLSRALFWRYAPRSSEIPDMQFRRPAFLKHGFWLRLIILVTFSGFAAASLYAALHFAWP